MEKVILKAMIREEFGKQGSKRLRAQGDVPAVVYKKGKEALPVKVNDRELFHTLHTSAGENVIITLKIGSETKEASPSKDRTVIIKEIQYEPIKGDVLHLDFNEISLTEKITVNVQIELKGESEGVKAEGGILDNPTKELQVECLPTAIPEKIEVQVGGLRIGDSIKVKDLIVPDDVKVLTDPEVTVLSVMPPQVEKPAEEAVEEEITEPEVIREKKLEKEAASSEPEKAEKPKKE